MRTMQLKPEDDATEIARILSDYDLTAAPVVDDETRMIGIVTVDDVLELILPRRPRRPLRASDFLCRRFTRVAGRRSGS